MVAPTSPNISATLPTTRAPPADDLCLLDSALLIDVELGFGGTHEARKHTDFSTYIDRSSNLGIHCLARRIYDSELFTASFCLLVGWQD